MAGPLPPLSRSVGRSVPAPPPPPPSPRSVGRSVGPPSLPPPLGRSVGRPAGRSPSLPSPFPLPSVGRSVGPPAPSPSLRSVGRSPFTRPSPRSVGWSAGRSVAPPHTPHSLAPTNTPSPTEAVQNPPDNNLGKTAQEQNNFSQYGTETRGPTSSTMKIFSLSSSSGVSFRGRPPAKLFASSHSSSLRAWEMIARMARALPRSPSKKLSTSQQT